MTETEELSSEEILAAVETVHRRTVEDSAALFRFAYEFATIHNGEAANASDRVLPGTERSVRLGGAGTPPVMEFAAVQLGARMQLGPVAARHYMADALDVWHRLPRIAGRLEAGEVRVALARLVAKETRHLSSEAAGQVDADMAEVADGRLPWGRFCDRLEGRIVAADPELARAREEEARQRQFARPARFSDAGMRAFFLRAPTAWIARFDATVAYLADALAALGDTDDLESRRVKACLVMANPTQAVEVLAAYAAHRAGVTDEPLPGAEAGEADPPQEKPEQQRGCTCTGDPTSFTRPVPFRPRDVPGWLMRLSEESEGWRPSWSALLPTVTLYAHVAAETLQAGEGVVRWESDRPQTLDYLRDHVAPFQRMSVTPVLDLAGQEPVDAYEIPGRHRQAVHLRTPADCFPFSSTTSRRVDIDHTVEFDAAPGSKPGQSRMANYGPLGRFNHRVKTFGHWTVRQPFDGIYVWRDPSGEFYLVDHTGTRKVTDGTLPTRRTNRVDPELHLYEATGTVHLVGA